MKALAVALASLAAAAAARAADPPPLVLDGKIALGKVSGRIDHLAVDLERHRLFIAELGNDTVGVVDLKHGKVEHRIKGLREPQGVGYVAATDTLYAADAKDGVVTIFRGEALTPAGRIDLKDDADNVRVDAAGKQVYVGYGSGALAVIDPATQRKLADIPLKAHPESFQLDPASSQIYVNVPDAHEIAVVDRTAQKQIAAWHVPEAGANFPMALDSEGKRVLAVFRHPPLLAALDAATGAIAAKVGTCGDADDVFVDAKRKRVYVSCGAGYIEVFAAGGDAFTSLARLPTASGARTSLFVPALDRLYLAVRATASEPAAVWVYRPQP